MPAARTDGPRYLTLDHWRGFAALWVMVFHAFNTWLEVKPDFLPGWLAWFCLHGWLGLHVFFVISGYCIAERTAREYRRRGSVRLFALDRLRRIYPPYWAALAATILINVAAALVAGAPLTVANGPLPDGGNGWIQTLFVVEHWFGQPSYLLVAWTLSYEIGFYLLAALCLGLALGTARAWTGYALGGLLLIAGLVPAIGTWLPLLELWPHFAVGGLAWLLLHGLPGGGRRLAGGTLIFAGLALVAWLPAAGRGHPMLFVTACAWLLLLLQPFDARLAAAPVLRWLGRAGTISYSIYLVHAPIVGKFRNLLSRYWQPGDPGAIWVPLAACGLAVACAWGFYRLVEVRTERWRRERLRRPITA